MTARSPAGIGRAALAVIVLLAALLRVGFFVGLVSGDPQDDGIYYNNAFAIYTAGDTQLERFRDPPADWLPNPVDQFHVRPMVTYPIAAVFTIVGPGEIAAAVWGFVCSLMTIVVVYRLGLLMHDRSVGLIAALLCAFYPLEVINGTRILSDVQVGMFAALALLLLVEAEGRGSLVLCALSGAAVGGAYLANARALIFLLVLLTCTVLQRLFPAVPPTTRRSFWQTLTAPATWRVPLAVLAGFCGVFATEAAIYFLRTGDPLLSYHIQAGASYFKYLHEPVTSIDWGWLRLSYTNGQPFELLRSVLLMNDRFTNQFGLFFLLFFASALFSVVKRRNLLLLAVAAGLCLYLEFGPVQLAFDWPARKLHYMMVFKQERFLLILTAPFAVLSAYLLQSVWRTSRVAAVVVLLVLTATSIEAVTRTRAFYRAGLHDLRAITDYVSANPTRTFFGDFWAVEHVKIFSRHRAQNLRAIGPQTAVEEIKGGCIMLGGSRGVELLADYVESTLPPFARDVLATGNAPPRWQLVREIHGAHNDQRRRDFRVYCVL